MTRIGCARWLEAALLVSLASTGSAQCPTLEPVGFCGNFPEAMAIRSMASCDLGSGAELYLGGRYGATCGGQSLGQFVKWTGTGWVAPGGGILGQEVVTIAAHDDGTGPAVYVGGNFSQAGGMPARNVARWDGIAWSALPGAGTLGVQSLVSHDDGTGRALYVAGRFGDVWTGSRQAVARWRNGAWSRVGDLTPSFTAMALAVFDFGSGPVLCAGGARLMAGGGAESVVYSWDGAVWTQVAGPLGPTGGGNDPIFGVNSLLAYDDGNGPLLHICGDVSSSGPHAFQGIARWRNGAWEPVGGVSSLLGYVRTMTIHDDDAGGGSMLYLAGAFSLLGGLTARNIARWNGASWQPVPDLEVPTFNAGISALASYDAPGRERADLWIGGLYAQVGPAEPPQGLARWLNCDSVGTIGCNSQTVSSPCPCSNDPPPTSAGGCLNSTSRPGLLRARGRASVAGDTLVLFADALPGGVPLAFVQGSNSVFPSAFGEGLECAGGVLVRIAVRGAGGAHEYPAGGEPPISTAGAIAAPATRVYQVLYRDPGGLCALANATNSVEISWGV